CYQAAARLCQQTYATRALKADEGGLAPPFPNVETMLDDAVESIRSAGFEPGREVALAVDVASSHFFDGSRYALGNARLGSNEMIDSLAIWVKRWPIVSIE